MSRKKGLRRRDASMPRCLDAVPPWLGFRMSHSAGNLPYVPLPAGNLPYEAYTLTERSASNSSYYGDTQDPSNFNQNQRNP